MSSGMYRSTRRMTHLYRIGIVISHNHLQLRATQVMDFRIGAWNGVFLGSNCITWVVSATGRSDIGVAPLELGMKSTSAAYDPDHVELEGNGQVK
jgi:hypothetical protein